MNPYKNLAIFNPLKQNAHASFYMQFDVLKPI